MINYNYTEIPFSPIRLAKKKNLIINWIGDYQCMYYQCGETSTTNSHIVPIGLQIDSISVGDNYKFINAHAS